MVRVVLMAVVLFKILDTINGTWVLFDDELKLVPWWTGVILYMSTGVAGHYFQSHLLIMLNITLFSRAGSGCV